MSSIGIFMLLVRCSADLLVCEAVQNENLRYVAMETCRGEVAQLVSDRSVPGGSVYMGKCVYGMDHADQRRAHRHDVFAKGGLVQTAELLRQTRR